MTKGISKLTSFLLAILVLHFSANVGKADDYLPVAYLGAQISTTNTYADNLALTALRAITTNLNGSGINMGQPEASAPIFEVSPTNTGESVGFFTYYYNGSISTVYTNTLGTDSAHADNVGADLYGMNFGVATNVAHVDNYDAQTFVYNYISPAVPITDQVINQSYTFGAYYTYVDQWFDNYAAQYGVLFVSGAGYNNAPVYSPATCYNGIAVGVYNNAGSAYGPTVEGRSKPDITAWGNQDTVTSYSTPVVAGAAAILWQAGERGDGGNNTNSAVDIRTIKALLLNGAVKPIGWTNSALAPLHPVYGAGMVNVLNSYEQLAGGQHGYISSNSVASGAAHAPVGLTGFTNSEGVMQVTVANNTAGQIKGWDFNNISSGSSSDAVNHYLFQVNGNQQSPTSIGTATLVWNRQYGQSGINNLELFLYNVMSGSLISCSTSLVDNVQHIYIPKLPPGKYDLQVWKAGGSSIVSSTETYALAYQFYAPSVTAVPVGTNIVLTWPVYPSGFMVQAATNSAQAAWTSLTNTPPVIVGNNYQLTVPAYDPNAISIIVATNSGSGSGAGITPGGGDTTNNTTSVYNNFMDLHYFRVASPNF